MSFITCKNISLGYDGKTIAEQIEFYVNVGDYLCIVGENGSGKSTLMKTLLGLKAPLSGQIITGDGFERNEIGYLPQQTVIQKDFPASVQEIVQSGCLNRCGLRPFYNKVEKQMVQTNMEKIGISHLAKRCYRELSGGQQQRVLLARALCASRKLLLLDEPAAGLDPQGIGDMYQLIEELNSEEGITIIMISHDVSAVKYASHVLHLNTSSHFFGKQEDFAKTDYGRAFESMKGGDGHGSDA